MSTISHPIDIGISDEQVNLKHLLWQLREQQSALSDVALLRQEVLSMKLSYNSAKAEFQPVRDSIEGLRDSLKKERELSREELLQLSEEFTHQLQELRAQQEGTQEACVQMMSTGKDQLKQVSDLEQTCWQLRRRMDEDLEASKRQMLEVAGARKASEASQDVAQRLEAALGLWQPRLVQLEEELRQQQQQGKVLKETVEQESSHRSRVEDQVLKEQTSMSQELSELSKQRGISDERMKDFYQKLKDVAADVLENCKALANVETRLAVSFQQGTALVDLQQNVQQLQSDTVLHSERLEHFQMSFDHEMQLHRSQEHACLSEELKELQKCRERDGQLLKQALGFGAALEAAEARWQKSLERCEELHVRQASMEGQLHEAMTSARHLEKQSCKLEERSHSLHEELQKLQMEDQVYKADVQNKMKDLSASSTAVTLEMERQKQMLSTQTQQLQRLADDAQKMNGQMEAQLQSSAQQAFALSKTSEEIEKLQRRSEEQGKDYARLAAEQSAGSQKQSALEAWNKTTESKVSQLAEQLNDVHSQVVRCEAFGPELNRLEQAISDQARRNESAQSQAKEMIHASTQNLKVLMGEVKEELKEDLATHSQQLLQLSQQEASIQAEAAITRSEQVQLEKGLASCVERMARVEASASTVAAAMEKAEAQLEKREIKLEKDLAACVERLTRVESKALTNEAAVVESKAHMGEIEKQIKHSHEQLSNQTKHAVEQLRNEMKHDDEQLRNEMKHEDEQLGKEMKQQHEQFSAKMDAAKKEQATSHERLAERLGDRLASVEQLSSRLQALQGAESKQQREHHEALEKRCDGEQQARQELHRNLQLLHEKLAENETLHQRSLRDLTELSDKLHEAQEVKAVEDRLAEEKLRAVQASIDEARVQNEHHLHECLQVLDGQIMNLREQLDGQISHLQEQVRTSSLEQTQLTTSSVRSTEKGLNAAVDSCKRGLDRLEERLQSNDLRFAQQLEKLAKLETKESFAHEEQEKHHEQLLKFLQGQLRKGLEDLHGKTVPLLERCQEEVLESKVALKAFEVELSSVKVHQKELKDDEAALQQVQGLEFQQVHVSAERAHSRLDALEGRLEASRQRHEQRLEELQAAQWTWSADKAALESQGSSSRQRIEGLEKTLEAYLSKDLLESVRSEMEHFRSRLATAEQQQASSCVELRKLLDAELAGAQAALRERLSEALAKLPPLEESLRDQAQRLEVKLSYVESRSDDLAEGLQKERKCRENDVAKFNEGLHSLDSTSSSCELKLEALREAHGHLEAEVARWVNHSKSQGQELFDHFLEVRHQIEDVHNLVVPLADELHASEENLEGKLTSEQQRREMKEAALKEQLESERAARELQRRELTAVLSRERQAFERLTVLERSILSVEELARREMEARAREGQRLWDALDHLNVGEVREVRAEEPAGLLPCQPLTTLLRLGHRELRD